MVRYSTALAAVLVAAGMLAQRAHADVYTWVDAAGNVNVSNLAPPAGARIRSVAHESPAAVARAEAARAAAKDDEVRALAERVAELEHAAAAPRAPAPVLAMARPQPPTPRFSVTMMPSTSPDDAAPAVFPSCGSLDCVPLLGTPFYAPSVVVIAPPVSRRHHRDHAMRRGGAPGLAASPRGPRRS